MSEVAKAQVVEESSAAVSKVAVLQQRAGAGVQAESPLHHVGLDHLALNVHQRGGVALREKKLLGHLVLRGNSANASLLKGIKKVLGVELPLAPLSCSAKGTTSIQWMGPDEWLILVEGGSEYGIELALREAIDGHISLVNVSGGQTVLELSGPDARKVLQKSTPYDVHPGSFPVGKCVSTVFAKTQVLLQRTGEDSYEMVVRRSFSDYMWLWLQDASAEYGLVIKA
ncbi:sarcosine oxidase subunit gamma [Pokkaliibacter plantistimulans]|uniref:Sarcosine oxidase subunit gamma n=1 Tax=Pokkaliibacter plantistimulans TaxID=1635171 RepID=A0ABX5M4W0_9GAMM|nr:sarcosine oxidase subunit gamma family protein [Pokkaliibacter plantistimulans]PXF31950.1 sarcosine oxidase subunit gamma [Pokkaliibacter plantistimulans]